MTSKPAKSKKTSNNASEQQTDKSLEMVDPEALANLMRKGIRLEREDPEEQEEQEEEGKEGEDKKEEEEKEEKGKEEKEKEDICGKRQVLCSRCDSVISNNNNRGKANENTNDNISDIKNDESKIRKSDAGAEEEKKSSPSSSSNHSKSSSLKERGKESSDESNVRAKSKDGGPNVRARSTMDCPNVSVSPNGCANGANAASCIPTELSAQVRNCKS